MASRGSTLDTYFDQNLMTRTVLQDQPPTLHYFDEQINKTGGLSFALGLQRHTLQTQKRLPRPSHEHRMIEMVRETSSYRRELRFFRTIYQVMEEILEDINSVVQQLTLNYYIWPNDAGQADGQWLQLANELNLALQKYTGAVHAAAEDWIYLERDQKDRDRSSKV